MEGDGDGVIGLVGKSDIEHGPSSLRYVAE